MAPCTTTTSPAARRPRRNPPYGTTHRLSAASRSLATWSSAAGTGVTVVTGASASSASVPSRHRLISARELGSAVSAIRASAGSGTFSLLTTYGEQNTRCPAARP